MELHSSTLGRRNKATAAEKAAASHWESAEILSLLCRTQSSSAFLGVACLPTFPDSLSYPL